MHRHLTYSSDDDDDDIPTDDVPLPDNTLQAQHYMDTSQHPFSTYTLKEYVNLEEDKEEEDFPTVICK